MSLVCTAHAQPEILNRDGFPADYQAQDFTPAATPATPALAAPVNAPHLDPLEANDQANAALQKQSQRSKTARPLSLPSTVLKTPQGQVVGKSFSVDQLPHTAALAPGEISRTNGNLLGQRPAPTPSTSGTVAGTAPALALPQPALPVLAERPTDAGSLAGWGPLTPVVAGLQNEAADPERIWAGVSATEVLNLLAQITKQPPASAALRTGLIRLLLTRATPPAGLGPDWLITRANVLTALGRDEAALQLWQAVPAALLAPGALKDVPSGTTITPANTALVIGWVQAQLVAGETAPACDAARRQVAQPALPLALRGRWQQAVAVCQELAGATQGAHLSWQLAHDQGAPAEPLLATIATAWESKHTLNETILTLAGPEKTPLNPLAVALLAARPALLLDVPALLLRLPQVALRRMMNTGGLPLQLRLAAAENLAAGEGGGTDLFAGEGTTAGSDASPDAAAVALLYQALSFDQNARIDPLGQAAILHQGKKSVSVSVAAGQHLAARALLWQTASTAAASSPVSLRALAWLRWHDYIIQAGLGGLVTGLPVGRAAIHSENNVSWLAPMVLAGHWRTGQPAPAEWLNVMASTTLLAPHLPQLILANQLLAGAEPSAAEWATALNGSAITPDAARLVAVANALGLPPSATVTQSAWANAGAVLPTAAPAPLWQGALTAAAQNHQAGLALLLVAQPQAGEDPTATGWLTARLIALRSLGLEGVAHKLAGEALALPLAGLTSAVAPAPPPINQGHAPIAEGHEIGGGQAAPAPTLPNATTTDDGLILPPPRIQSIHKPTVKKPTFTKLGRLTPTPAGQ